MIALQIPKNTALHSRLDDQDILCDISGDIENIPHAAYLPDAPHFFSFSSPLDHVNV